MGGFGGGSLEHPRPRLESLGAQSYHDRQARAEEAWEPSWGTAEGLL